MSAHYILDGHRPVAVADLLAWARWYESANRRVAETVLSRDVRISTVFLGLNHNFDGAGAPLLFETLVFGGDHDGNCERCATWDEAVAQHAAMVRRVQALP